MSVPGFYFLQNILKTESLLAWFQNASQPLIVSIIHNNFTKNNWVFEFNELQMLKYYASL